MAVNVKLQSDKAVVRRGLRIVDSRVPEILKQCCDLVSPATLLLPDTSKSYAAHFADVTTKTITLNLAGSGEIDYRNAAICFVTYSLNGRQHVFMTSMIAPDEAEMAVKRHVNLEMPPNLAITQMRRWFRVPVVDPKAVNLRVQGDEGPAYFPTLINLSMGGLLVEFDEKKIPSFADKEILRLRLSVDTLTVEREVEVRQPAGARCGMMFVKPRRKKIVEQQARELNKITNLLERKWLEHKATTLDD